MCSAGKNDKERAVECPRNIQILYQRFGDLFGRIKTEKGIRSSSWPDQGGDDGFKVLDQLLSRKE